MKTFICMVLRYNVLLQRLGLSTRALFRMRILSGFSLDRLDMGGTSAGGQSVNGGDS